MLVKYKSPGGSAGWTLLFDESRGDACEKFAPSFRDVIYKPGGYGAVSAPRIPMNGTEGVLPLKWSQNYATADAAGKSIADLRAIFKGVKMHFEITIGAQKLYFPNATLASSSHDQKSREMLHDFNFETDDLTLTEPA